MFFVSQEEKGFLVMEGSQREGLPRGPAPVPDAVRTVGYRLTPVSPVYKAMVDGIASRLGLSKHRAIEIALEILNSNLPALEGLKLTEEELIGRVRYQP